MQRHYLPTSFFISVSRSSIIHIPICFPEVVPLWEGALLVPEAAERLSIRASKSSTVVVSLAALLGVGAGWGAGFNSAFDRFRMNHINMKKKMTTCWGVGAARTSIKEANSLRSTLEVGGLVLRAALLSSLLLPRSDRRESKSSMMFWKERLPLCGCLFFRFATREIWKMRSCVCECQDCVNGRGKMLLCREAIGPPKYCLIRCALSYTQDGKIVRKGRWTVSQSWYLGRLSPLTLFCTRCGILHISIMMKRLTILSKKITSWTTASLPIWYPNLTLYSGSVEREICMVFLQEIGGIFWKEICGLKFPSSGVDTLS